MKKIKWTKEAYRYLFEMAVAVTEYRTINITPKLCITMDGRRKITKLMQIKYSPGEFWLTNVSQMLKFVTNRQTRGQLGSSHHHVFDKTMHAAMVTGFISGSEFAERMTN